MNAWALVLTGSSSAGKTGLARALQNRCAQPAWLFVADECFPAGPPIRTSGTEAAGESPIVLFHRGIAAWMTAGNNVIVDGSLPYDDHRLRARCLDELRGAGEVHLVGVTATVDELRVRERQRSDARPPGWAVRQHRDVNDGLELACSVDTTDRPPTSCAEDVLAQLSARTGQQWV